MKKKVNRKQGEVDMITKKTVKDVLTVLRELNLTVRNSRGCELMLTNNNIELITNKANFDGDEFEEEIVIDRSTINAIYY